MPHRSPQIGVLLIHGTLGHSQEFEDLEVHLRSHGYQTLAVDLPAHGESPTSCLGEICADEILDHCLSSYHQLASQCNRVVVLGHSLGGICSLIIGAQQDPKLAGIIALSTPYEYAYSVNYTYGLFSIPIRRLVKAVTYLPQSRTQHKTPRFRPWWFPRLYQQTQQILGQLQAVLPQVQVPVYLAHAHHDLIVPYAEMGKIASALTQSQQVTTLTLKACGHQVFPGTREESRVSQWVLDCIASIYHQYTQAKEQPTSADCS